MKNPIVTEADRQACSAHLSADERSVVIIDQTQLPNREIWLELHTAEDIYDAIKRLAVRGAPAIGICAGYAMYVLAQQEKTEDPGVFLANMERMGEYLVSSRPTAVNLSWAVHRMLDVIRGAAGRPVTEICGLLRNECLAIHNEDIQMCYRISEYGLSLVKPGDGILTHCNAGPLATSKYGTAIGPVLLGKERGIDFRVFSDETRPLLQGARLTSYELQRAGVDVTLICDNMASLVMKNGWVQAVFVGCDRIAANGDFANKIGTYDKAIVAKKFGIPFYVAAPVSTFDFNTKTGKDIVIEQRSEEEMTMIAGTRIAPIGSKALNPAFDVTTADLVTGFITEKGIFKPSEISGMKE